MRLEDWDETLLESESNDTRLNGETCGTHDIEQASSDG